MKQKLQIVRRAAALLLSIMLLCSYASASAGNSSDFHNTYWLMRSYTGNFYIAFYENGTYFSEACFDPEIRFSGKWSYSNDTLTLDDIKYTRHGSGNEICYVTADGTIGLYPNQDSTNFDAIAVYVDSSGVTWTDAVPYIDSNNRTMVPLRAVADAMGLTVTWNQKTETATFTGEAYYDGGEEYSASIGMPCEVSISFKIGSKTASVSYKSMETAATQTSKKSVQMNTTPVIQNGRTYAPIRYLAEAFGFGVDWNGDAKMITLKYGYIAYPFR